MNKFFFLKEFYKNFNFPWVYKNIFYYRLERNKRIRSSSYVPIELKRDGKTYCNDFDFNSWNMFNGDLIFFNTNFLFKRIFLFLKYFKSNSYLLDMRCNRILIKYLKNSLFKKKNWLNKIFIKKRYSIDLKKKKKIFFKDLSQLFWNLKLIYHIEYYKIGVNKIFLNNFFLFIKYNPISFFINIASIIYYFPSINFFNKRTKSFEFIYNEFLLFFFNKLHFNLIKIFFFIRLVIFYINKKISFRKIIFSIYNKFKHLERLDIYFYNLLNDTTLIDFWLEKKNLCGKKFSILFTKILFSFNWKKFNLKRRPWHSFYNRFYDILIYMKLNKYNYNNLYKSFYRIFFKLLVFIKKNKNNFRKKSFESKPIRRGVKVYL